jgi:hypothetical protein
MQHLTLQEVIDKINRIHSSVSDQRAVDDHATDQKHRPEFYIPRVTRRLAKLIFSFGT